MKTIAYLLAGAASVAMAGGCARVEGHEPRPARPVKVHAVTPGARPAGVRYSASIDVFEQVPLAFKASGYVDAVLRRSGADGRLRVAQPGDLIARGTVLARVRDAEYKQHLGQGSAGMAEAEAGVAKAKLDLNRSMSLFASESLTKPELDAAQANFDASQARLAAARAEHELAAIALRDCALIAPSAGIVLERKIETGTLVGSGTVGFVLGDISAVKARFGIPDAAIQSLSLGDRIELAVEAVAGTTFEGRVTEIAPAADAQSRVFDVEVTIPNHDGRLRPGMIGTVSLRPAGAAAVIASALPSVPLAAIVRSKTGASGYAAFIVERRGDTQLARLREVQLGDVVGNEIGIVKGLTTGDQVIVAGASLLVDGEAVRVVQ